MKNRFVERGAMWNLGFNESSLEKNYIVIVIVSPVFLFPVF